MEADAEFQFLQLKYSIAFLQCDTARQPAKAIELGHETTKSGPTTNFVGNHMTQVNCCNSPLPAANKTQSLDEDRPITQLHIPLLSLIGLLWT